VKLERRRQLFLIRNLGVQNSPDVVLGKHARGVLAGQEAGKRKAKDQSESEITSINQRKGVGNP